MTSSQPHLASRQFSARGGLPVSGDLLKLAQQDVKIGENSEIKFVINY